MNPPVPFTLEGWRALAAAPIASASDYAEKLGGVYAMGGRLAISFEGAELGCNRFKIGVSFPDGTAWKSCLLSLIRGPSHPYERQLEELIRMHQGEQLGVVGFCIPHRGGPVKKQARYLRIPGLVEVVANNRAIAYLSCLPPAYPQL